MKKASSFLEEAALIVSGERERQHGDKLRNHNNIAQLWSVWARLKNENGRPAEDSAEDVAVKMALLKLARTLEGAHNPDDYLDAMGYIACAAEIASRTRT